MTYDLIIPTQSKGNLIQMTQRCIDSARAEADVNVIIVESGDPYKYEGISKSIEYNGEFNYNRALNLGLKYAKGDVHILANNDIYFHEGWSKIGELMKANEYHSASAWAPHLKMFKEGEYIYEGYQVGYIFTGWCLFMDNYCREKIGKLDESVNFWYSDNLYALQLQTAGITHAMFCNVRVDHLCSQTLKKQPSRLQRQYQLGEMNRFISRQKHYAKGKGNYKADT